MGLEKRLFLNGRSSSDLIDEDAYYPPHEIYLCDQDMGVSEEDLVKDLMDWAEYFPEMIRDSDDDELRRYDLINFDKLYEVSQSPIVGEALRELHSEGYYAALDVDEKNVINYLDLIASLRDVEPREVPERAGEVQRLGEIIEELIPPREEDGEFDYDEFQNNLYAFNKKSSLELAAIVGLTGMTLATVGYLLAIQ